MTGQRGGSRSAPAGLDTSAANVARVYDYLLYGKDNFAADRAAAEEIIRLVPGAPQACRQNRGFLERVVRYLATEEGIAQFIDLGCGLPAARNVHEVARESRPQARVAYVDYDPVVVSRAQNVLAGRDERLTAVLGDIRNPEGVIGDAGVRAVIDFSRPVGVLMFAVLHFLPDGDRPAEVARAFAGAVAPGSFLALSHAAAGQLSEGAARAVARVYEGASAQLAPRRPEEIRVLFGGLELRGPGLVDIGFWPEQNPDLAPGGARGLVYGGVAVKHESWYGRAALA